MTTTTMILCIGNLPPKCRDAAGEALAERFGGWTRSEAQGAWRSPEGRLFVEPMDRWEVATTDPEAFTGMIVGLGEAAGEHSVYVVTGGAPAILETAHGRAAEAAKVNALRD